MADLLEYALTTVADVKETLGITSSEYDNLIIRKINQATETIERVTGRRFKLTEYTNEEYDSTGTNQLILKNYPIVVDGQHPFSFGARDTSLNEDDWDTVDSELQFLDKNAGVIDLSFNTWGTWNRYRASFWAGYATIPSDLAEAATELASYLVQSSSGYSSNSNNVDEGIKRITEGQRSVEYFDTSSSSGGGGSTTGINGIFSKLGIDGTLNSYSKYPILADK